jgi:hypothetical protein
MPEDQTIPTATPARSIVFIGQGQVSTDGTGTSSFLGEGSSQFTGQFDRGFFSGQLQGQIDGTGQMNFATLPNGGVVGGFNNFAGSASFEGIGAAAITGQAVTAVQGDGIGGFWGQGRGTLDGTGQLIMRGGRQGQGYSMGWWCRANRRLC